MPFILHLIVGAWVFIVAASIAASKDYIYMIDIVKNYNSNMDCLQNCINPETEAPYAQNDTCVQESFNESCACTPEMLDISCKFFKFEKGSGGWLGNWMTWYNIFGFFWAMEFVTAFGEMVLAGKNLKYSLKKKLI